MSDMFRTTTTIKIHDSETLSTLNEHFAIASHSRISFSIIYLRIYDSSNVEWIIWIFNNKFCLYLFYWYLFSSISIIYFRWDLSTIVRYAINVLPKNIAELFRSFPWSFFTRLDKREQSTSLRVGQTIVFDACLANDTTGHRIVHHPMTKVACFCEREPNLWGMISMLQNEVLKNERFIGALSRSAQNTVVPFVNLRVAFHFFHSADSEIYSR